MGVLNSFYYVGQILAAGISVSRISATLSEHQLTITRFPLVERQAKNHGEDQCTCNVDLRAST